VKNKQYNCVLLLLCAVFASTGCAAIFNSPIQSVRIDSKPQNAKFTIVDKNGEQVAEGVTPGTVKLHASAEPFQPARYFVNYEHEAFPPMTRKLTGRLSRLYIVDILLYIPGWVGAIIVDPYTGTMYNLPDESRAELANQSSSTADDGTAKPRKKPKGFTTVPAQ